MQLSKTDIHIYKEALYLRFGFNDILQANKLYLAWYFFTNTNKNTLYFYVLDEYKY